MRIDPKITIVIINYNGLTDTMECLSSITKITYPRFSVIVVDNASDENELPILQSEYPQYSYLQSEINGGFSAANNLGIQQALTSGADCVLLLNNDTTVTPGFIEPMVDSLFEYPKVGMVTPQICYYSQKDVLWMSGGTLNKYTGTGYMSMSGEKLSISPVIQHTTFISGCCALITKEVLLSIGPWDEKYFLYMEDIDYSYRVSMAGYTMLVVRNSVIYHKVNASTRKNNNQQPIYYMIRNRLYFVSKYFDRASIFAFGFILISTLIKLVWWYGNNPTKYSFGKMAVIDYFKGHMGKLTVQPIH
jgi:GT2 family glycosyltransferase